MLEGDWGGSGGETVSRGNRETGGCSGNIADSGPSSTEIVWSTWDTEVKSVDSGGSPGTGNGEPDSGDASTWE